VHPLGQREGPVGRDGGEGDLDHRVLDALGELRRGEAQQGADQRAARDDPHEVQQGVGHRERAAGDPREHEGEHHHRGAVVEQALALHQHREALGRAEALEQTDDRDGVGGGEERGEDQGVREPEARRDVQRLGGRHEHHRREPDGHAQPRDRQRVDRELVRPELLEIQVKRGLEDQPREEHREEQLLAQVGRGEHPGGAQREPGDDQRDGERRTEPARDQRDRRGHQKEGDVRRLVSHRARG
jgi:hypothetical protein